MIVSFVRAEDRSVVLIAPVIRHRLPFTLPYVFALY